MGVEKTRNFVLVMFFFLLVIISMFFVFADHIVLTSDGNDFSPTEDTNYIFNLSVNNSGFEVNGNITEVNISLPSTNFSFSLNSNVSAAPWSNFTNTSTVLSWRNFSSLITANTTSYFAFNATIANPGTYYFTITTTNSTVSNTTTLSFAVNDSTNPAATFGTNPIANYNSSNSNVTFDLLCGDNTGAINVIQLWANFSGTWVANQTNSTPANGTYWNISVAGIADGRYIWGVYCNDSTNNNDYTDTNRTLTVDTTSPVPGFTCSATSVNVGEVITCSCSGTDSGSGILTAVADSPNTASSGTKTVTCAVSDYAGNTASSTITYTVTEAGSSSSSSSGGGSSSSFWIKGTYSASASEISEGYNKKIIERQRVKLSLEGENHYVGIRDVGETTAKIEVTSDPQQKEMSVGEEWKVEVTGDDYYDLSVILNSVQSGVVDLTIKSISEKIMGLEEEVGEEVVEKDETTASITGEVVNEESNRNNFVWVVLVVVLVVLVLLWFFIFQKKIKKKNFSF